MAIEEHSVISGLGGALAEVVAEAAFDPAKRFKRIGIPDVFPHGYGSQATMAVRHHGGANQIVVGNCWRRGHAPTEDTRPIWDNC